MFVKIVGQGVNALAFTCRGNLSAGTAREWLFSRIPGVVEALAHRNCCQKASLVYSMSWKQVTGSPASADQKEEKVKSHDDQEDKG